MVSKEKTKEYNSKRPEYITWSAMKYRCLEKSKQRSRYFDRGITICERWIDFKNFKEDMGLRPKGTELDRIDNNKGYYKENCRWVTRSVNMHNKKPSKKSKSGLPIGVHVSRNELVKKYRARIIINKIIINIGSFSSIEEAKHEYDKLSIEWYGKTYAE